jgi:hypothetical protein
MGAQNVQQAASRSATYHVRGARIERERGTQKGQGLLLLVDELGQSVEQIAALLARQLRPLAWSSHHTVLFQNKMLRTTTALLMVPSSKAKRAAATALSTSSLSPATTNSQ